MALLALGAGSAASAEGRRFAWLAPEAAPEALAARFAVPAGYRRVPAAPGSFAAWLRGLPLRPAGARVHLYDGREKARQDLHAAVIDIDVGRRDLQQCADAVIRLRAEYLYAAGRAGTIHFDFTSGDRADFARWARGWRPLVTGNRVAWRRSGARGAGHGALMRYLATVFAYAGTHSLARELVPVADRDEIAIGDVFVQGGFPGHAAIVVDLAEAPGRGAKLFLLAQGFMPAQELYVLRNPRAPALDPWYALTPEPVLETPEWRFRWRQLSRFPDG